jgi:hypothetical protein
MRVQECGMKETNAKIRSRKHKIITDKIKKRSLETFVVVRWQTTRTNSGPIFPSLHFEWYREVYSLILARISESLKR